MKLITWISLFLIVTSCSEQIEKTVDRSDELVGKVYHFSTELDEEDCNLLLRPNICYNSTYIGFLDKNTFVSLSRCGGYVLCYSGDYQFSDTLKLKFVFHSMYESYSDSLGNLVERILDVKSTLKNQYSRNFIADTCGIQPYFVDEKVHEFGWSKHTVKTQAIYGMFDSIVSTEDVLDRIKLSHGDIKL